MNVLYAVRKSDEANQLLKNRLIKIDVMQWMTLRTFRLIL